MCPYHGVACLQSAAALPQSRLKRWLPSAGCTGRSIKEEGPRQRQSCNRPTGQPGRRAAKTATFTARGSDGLPQPHKTRGAFAQLHSAQRIPLITSTLIHMNLPDESLKSTVSDSLKKIKAFELLLIPDVCPGKQRLTCRPTLSTNQMRPWD